MLRMLLQYLVPLILPMAIYFAYMAATRWGEPDWMRQGPWFSLFALGVVLLCGSLIAFALMTGDDPTRTYVAPRFEDGQVTPGGFRD